MELADGEREVLEHAGQQAGAVVRSVDRDNLAAETFAALALGGVVVVARTGREASTALGMGADEIVRNGEISSSAIAATIDRARTRAAARLSREVHRAAQDDVEPVLSELVGALEQQLSDRLGQAALDLELLATSLPALLQVGDEFVSTASVPPSADELKELAARRLALPQSSALREALAHVQQFVRGAEKTSSTMRGISAHVATGPESIGWLVTRTIEILRPQLPEGVDVRLAVQGACAARAPALTVALTVTSLVARAADALREAAALPATIELRVSEHDDAVVLEVQDSVGGADGDLRPSLVEAYLATSPTPRTRLVRLRERIRRCGGDLVVDSDRASTTIRVFFPTRASEVVLGGQDTKDRLLPRGTR